MQERVPQGHIVRAYDEEIDRLRVMILELGSLVMQQVGQAVQALVERDQAKAKAVIQAEKTVDELDTNFEEQVIALIARRQPVASDLRTILSLSRAAGDLERCGDEAEKIARIARRLVVDEIEPVEEFEEGIDDMTRIAARLLSTCLRALDDSNIDLALKAAMGDKELDLQYKSALSRIHALLVEESDRIDHAADVSIVVKALERIGDHAKNIARYVIFVVTAIDVRHVKPKKLRNVIRVTLAER